MNDQVPPRSWLKGLSDSLVSIRSILVSIAVISVIVALVVVVWSEVRSRPIIFLPLTMPQEAQDAGYTGDVIAKRISDEINALIDLYRNDAYVKTVSSFSDVGILNVSIPETGITLRSIVDYIRSRTSFNNVVIHGEMMCKQEDCSLDDMRLRIRYGDESEFIEDLSIDINSDRSPFRRISRQIVSKIDPVTFAYYLYQKRKTKRAHQIVKDIKTDDPAIVQALTLSGLISGLRGNRPRALESYNSAIRIGGDSAELYNNIGDIHFFQNETQSALDYYRKSIELQDNAKARFFSAQIYQMNGESYNAIRAYRRVLKLSRQYDSNIFLISVGLDESKFANRLRKLFVTHRPNSDRSIILRSLLSRASTDGADGSPPE